MKLRQLHEMLTTINELEYAVQEADLSLSYGGHPETIERKVKALADAKQRLHEYLEQDIEI